MAKTARKLKYQQLNTHKCGIQPMKMRKCMKIEIFFCKTTAITTTTATTAVEVVVVVENNATPKISPYGKRSF